MFCRGDLLNYMGYLFLDTRVPLEACAWWLDEQKEEEVLLIKGRAQQLLVVFAKHRERFARELSHVAVVAGPGRFSSVRVGILYAHLLARWYRCPLHCLEPRMVETAETRLTARKRIEQGEIPAQSYIAPIYDREPHITLPRV